MRMGLTEFDVGLLPFFSGTLYELRFFRSRLLAGAGCAQVDLVGAEELIQPAQAGVDRGLVLRRKA
jgi:hypothetical protein